MQGDNMKVSLIDFNKDAMEKLIFTKNTRLKMQADGMERVKGMPIENKLEDIEYISNTIKSSWEFLDFTFMIEGVSRAFTHQFVRNRQGSYAQQTMRMLSMDDFEYVTNKDIKEDPRLCEMYDSAMQQINSMYKELIANGATSEDARGILPTNICTNIVAKYNLRTLSDMMSSRRSSRTQNEFREVIGAMYEAVVSELPWLESFLNSDKTKDISIIESFVLSSKDSKERLRVVKLLDKLRS
jgi:flavin-dependent thymidylate synthase